VEVEQWKGFALMPKAWVREVRLKGKLPRFEIIFKAKCVRTFLYREKADAFVLMMNLLLKE